MICVSLSGGLGNQIFQWAFGLWLESKGFKVVYDISSFENDAKREFELPEDCIKYGRIAVFKKNLLSGFVRKVWKKGYLRCEGYKYVSEDFFDVSSLNKSDKYYIQGEFQNWLYARHSSKYIRNKLSHALIDRKMYDDWFHTFEDKYKDYLRVAIHIRRGDYVTDSISSNFHGVMPIDYYINAINRISDGQPVCVVPYSDDIEWVINNFPLSEKDTLILPPKDVNNSPFADMYMMSLFDHKVIANSSFSWWGAMLGQDKEQTVIAPSAWFNSDSDKSKPLRFEDWSWV
ncbi:MAG: alpha-1,2-fucosyltransferase [Motiliproteus sp.]